MFLLTSLVMTATATAAPFLLIDDGAPETADIAAALESFGHSVTSSSDLGFLEYEFTGTEVNLSDFDAVIWTDGEDAAVFSMPDAGQWALHEYVLGGGGIVLFGQNGFNYLAGYHGSLGPLIPIRSWWVNAAGDYRPAEADHPMAEGFDGEAWLDVAGGEIRSSSPEFGLTTFEINPGWSERYVGAAAYEEGDGHGVQWALWGNSRSASNQTDWVDGVVASMLNNSALWAGQGPPRVDPGGPYVVTAGESVLVDGSGSRGRADAALASFTWEVDGLPMLGSGETLSLDTDGIDGPLTVELLLTVVDENGLSATGITTLTVENAAPEVTTIDCPASGAEGDTLVFSVEAVDPEEDDELTATWWRDGEVAGAGMSMEMVFAQEGSFIIEAAVSDDDGASTVAGCPDVVEVVNVAPVITGAPAASVDAGDAYTFVPSVTDPGVLDVHSWAFDGPGGMAIDGASGALSWTPGMGDVGVHEIRLTVSDGVDTGELAFDLEVQWPDGDGDGVRSDEDCDDEDSSIYPGAFEGCDAVDSDCDGDLADDFSDMDGDGLPDCIDTDRDGDGVDYTTDCNDGDSSIYPGAEEWCDLTDSDCDGSLADGFSDVDADDIPDCVDTDSDGDGIPDSVEVSWGLDPDDATDGSTDADGDGRTAADEFAEGTDPEVYEGPGTPSPHLPEDGAELNTLPAVLVVNDAAAPLGQVLTHSMLVARDASLETVVTSVEGLAGSPDGETTGWLIDVPLEENTWYYWSARAEDAYTAGAAMAPASFFVNLENEPPGVPVPSSPLDEESVDTLALEALSPADPDGDDVWVIFTLELDDGTLLTSAPTLASGDAVDWVPPLDAEDGDTFCWSAVAVDEHDLESEPSEWACFTIDTTNLPPSAPSFGDVVTDEPLGLSPEFVVVNGVDPEAAPTWHHFEVDEVPSFDSPKLQAEDVVSGEDGLTAWTPPVELQEDTVIHVRARCYDGVQYSDWVTEEFFVSAVNDPPSTPVLLNPADGVGLADGALLEVTASVDPEGQGVVYDFVVSDLRDQPVAEARGVEATGETVTWEPGDLPEGFYQWSTRAIDDSGVASEWAIPRGFYVGSPDYAEGVELDNELAEAAGSGCGCSQAPPEGRWLWLFAVLTGIAYRRKRPRC